MEYKKKFAETVQETLSKPFRSKPDACVELGITLSVFDEWVSEVAEFETAVSKGFLRGEKAAMDWLDKAAVQKSKMINLDHFWKKFERIYGTGAKSSIADNAEPVKWMVEFVKSEVTST